MISQAVADNLHRAISIRTKQLQRIVDNLYGSLGTSQSSLREALGLVRQFPHELNRAVEYEAGRAPDAETEISLLTPLFRHCINVLNDIESHFSHGARSDLSESLGDEIRYELVELGLDDYTAVVSHGPANNFETRFGDLASSLFQPLSESGVTVPDPQPYALFRIPRLEGNGVQWRPLLLGHEVAHVAAHKLDALAAFDLPSKFDTAAAATVPVPGVAPEQAARALYGIANNWAVELICDADAARRFGPAAIGAISEYLTYIGAADSPSRSHPHGALRTQLLATQLGAIVEPRLRSAIEPWIQAASSAHRIVEPWVEFLTDLFTAHLPQLRSVVEGWPGDAYDFGHRDRYIVTTADRFQQGIPGHELVITDHKPNLVRRADAVNATWIARVEDTATPYDRLALKTIESVDFVSRWITAGGIIPAEPHTETTEKKPSPDNEEGVGVLNAEQIAARLRRDYADNGLVVTPLLQLPDGVGLDLRLGNRFIVFKRTAVSSLDPIQEDDDPRAMQEYIEVAHSATFVLHPHEVVLGASLEYLAFPSDLCGQVVTRSSYGRLGLLTATAVQIQPNFRGCLTLELANLGTIPITLTPGQRIAQLVLSRTKVVAGVVPKYDCPIGPEFSKARSDPEIGVLRRIHK